MAHPKLSTQERDRLIEMYQSRQHTLAGLASHFAVTRTCITETLKRAGVQLHYGRKYDMNDAIFDTFSQESCWLLGLLMADGNLLTNKSNHAIFLGFKDVDLLKRARLVLGNKDIPIAKRRTQDFHSLRVTSQRAVARLQEIGMATRKPNHRFPEGIPHHLLGDFVRGLFDGDGSVYVHREAKRPRPRPAANMHTPNFVFQEKLHDRIEGEAGISVGKTSPPRFPFMTFGEAATRELYNWMYCNSAHLRSEAKYIKFSEIVTNY